MATRTLIGDVIAERTTRQYTTTLTNELGVPIPLADITVMTLTLYVLDAAGTIINGRSDTNILNANIGTYHATSGLLTILFTPADMAIIDTTASAEIHIALIEYTYGGGKEGAHEIQMTVSNLAKRP
jgi:hypothetical protein